MKKTEKQHWVNGHQVRGGWHHTMSISIAALGIMLYWGKYPNNLRRKSRGCLGINLFTLA